MKQEMGRWEGISREFIIFSITFLSIISVSIIAFFFEAILKGMVAITVTIAIIALFVIIPVILRKFTDTKDYTEAKDVDARKLSEALADRESEKAREEGRRINGIHNAIHKN